VEDTETLAVEVVVRLSRGLVRPEVLFQLVGKLLDVAEVVQDVDDTCSPDGRVGLGRRHVLRHRSYTSTTQPPTTVLQISGYFATRVNGLTNYKLRRSSTWSATSDNKTSK